LRSHRLALLLVVALLAARCGGGGDSSGSGTPGSPTSPTSPTTPTTPTGGPCSAIGAFAFTPQGIVNGSVCSVATTPVVLLYMRDKDNARIGRCSGTVIAPRAVLTAAHCLDDDVVAVDVYQGTGDLIASSSVAPHPSYRRSGDSSTGHDVGVVLLRSNLDRAPVPLLFSRDARVGESAIIAGWGTAEFGADITIRAGSTTVSAVNANWLESSYSGSGPGSNVCSGDSGGALLLSEGGAWVVGGVTSATSIGGSCASGTSYYTNVRNADVRSFILGLVPDLIQK
jgi:hypothetical protein